MQRLDHLRFVCKTAGIALLLSSLHGLCWAQSKQVPVHSPEAPIKIAPPMAEAGPRWSDLKPEQREILQPLHTLWPTLEENRKLKWLAIAKNFPTLSPQAQQIAQDRMREWAAMTPAQRYQARLHFAQSQQLSTDEKVAKWEAYQSLNNEEKNKLSQAQPAWSKGAAMAVRPVAPEKITVTPVTKKEGQEKPPRIETAEVHPLTLLPVKKRVLIEKP